MTDGPFIDLGMLAAHGNVNWDSYLYAGQSGFGTVPGPYAYGMFSTSVLGAAAQYSQRWWYRDFGAGGIWDIKIIHTTGFDVGIYSVRIDDREITRFNGYSLADVNNIERVLTGIRIGPGRHKFSVQIREHDPQCTGLPWYPAIQGVLFRQVGPLATPSSFGSPRGSKAGGGQVISIFVLFATGNTNWDNFLIENAMANTYELYSSGAQNATRYWDVDMAAGPWDLDVMYSMAVNRGIISVQVDGITQATVDTYSSSTVFGVRSIVRLNIPFSGTHRIAFTMATKNASSSSYVGDVSSLQMRQVSGPSMPHRIINFTTFWSHGNTNWDTLFTQTAGTASTIAYGGDEESTGAQNAARWWYLDIHPGTWDFSMVHTTAVNRGIYSIRLDDIEVGTIDGYSSPSVANVRSTVSGVKVTSGGRHKLSLVMASKNGSSSSYFGTVAAIQLRRTA